MGPLNWKWKKGNSLKKTQKNITFDMRGSYYNKCRVPENRSITGDELRLPGGSLFLLPCSELEALMFLMMSGTED